MTARETYQLGKYGLNKLASGDYDNVPAYQWVDQFNTFQRLYTRYLIKQAEKNKTNVDDIEFLLKQHDLKVYTKKKFSETSVKPEDYFAKNSLSIEGKKGECIKSSFKLYHIEESNKDFWLNDENKKPSFDWGETFYTLVGKKFRIYTGDDFVVISARLIYYREPARIIFEGVEDPVSGNLSSKTVDPEFGNDICELLVRGTVALISGDNAYLEQYKIKNDEVALFS